jgi:hypothetical protein
MDTIQNHNGDNIILGGNFNLTLTGSDSQRWQITEAERGKADIVNRRVNKNSLTVTWSVHSGYNWRCGRNQSRPDSKFTRLIHITVSKNSKPTGQ